MRKIYFITISILVVFGAAFFASFALADGTSPLPVIEAGSGVTMIDPMGSTGNGDSFTANQMIGRVISIVLGVVGSLGLALFTYAGLMWMSAAGNSSRIEKAKEIMIWTVIGMTIIFTAYALVKTIIEAMTGA